MAAIDDNLVKKYATAITNSLPSEGMGSHEYTLAVAIVLVGMCDAVSMPVAIQDSMMKEARRMTKTVVKVVGSEDN